MPRYRIDERPATLGAFYRGMFAVFCCVYTYTSKVNTVYTPPDTSRGETCALPDLFERMHNLVGLQLPSYMVTVPTDRHDADNL